MTARGEQNGTPAEPAPLLQLCEITKRFGGVQAANGITFGVRKKAITSLIGPNGSGKSTVFNTIAGEVVPDSGRVLLDGVEIQGLPTHVISGRGIGRTFQLTRVFGELTTLENLVVVDRSNRRSTAIRRALDMLDLVEISNLRNELAGGLSYGQQKLLELARALMIQPHLLLMDEPFAGINPALQDRLVKYLVGLVNEGITVLMIDHEMRIVIDVSDEVFVMDAGNLIAQGRPADIRANPDVIKAYF